MCSGERCKSVVISPTRTRPPRDQRMARPRRHFNAVRPPPPQTGPPGAPQRGAPAPRGLKWGKNRREAIDGRRAQEAPPAAPSPAPPRVSKPPPGDEPLADRVDASIVHA